MSPPQDKPAQKAGISDNRAAGDFWSRRRAAVAAEAREAATAEEAERLEEKRAALEEKSDGEILEELGLPDPDTMSKGDDFSSFLRAEVPDRLRRRALRRLWSSNPVLANLDSLVDYGEDFTDAATVVDNLQTAYRVGKGMLAHIEKQLEAEKTSAEVTEDEQDQPLESRDTIEDEFADGPIIPPEVEVYCDADLATIQPTETVGYSEVPDALTQEPALPSPRRMRFVYGDASKDTT